MNKDKNVEVGCRILEWDSNFWGFPVGRLDGSLLREGVERRVLDWCRGKKIRCLYFAADGSDAETLQRAHRAGYQFVDVRVDLECYEPTEIAVPSPNSSVCPVEKADMLTLKAIARGAHHDTRFFKDLNFDRSKCAELYEKWIERDFESGLVLGFFPKNRSEAGGYVTFSMESSDTARIGLIAVEEPQRGRGGGRMLLNSAMTLAADHGAKKTRVATQGTNVAALKLYEKAGFRVCDVKIWFHRWLSC